MNALKAGLVGIVLGLTAGCATLCNTSPKECPRFTEEAKRVDERTQIHIGSYGGRSHGNFRYFRREQSVNPNVWCRDCHRDARYMHNEKDLKDKNVPYGNCTGCHGGPVYNGPYGSNTRIGVDKNNGNTRVNVEHNQR